MGTYQFKGLYRSATGDAKISMKSVPQAGFCPCFEITPVLKKDFKYLIHIGKLLKHRIGAGSKQEHLNFKVHINCFEYLGYFRFYARN